MDDFAATALLGEGLNYISDGMLQTLNAIAMHDLLAVAKPRSAKETSYEGVNPPQCRELHPRQ